MRKNVIIIIISLLLTFTIYSHSFVIGFVNGVARATVPTILKKLGHVHSRVAIPAVVGTSLLFLRFDSLQTEYVQPSSSSLLQNEQIASIPETIEHNGVLYTLRWVGVMNGKPQTIPVPSIHYRPRVDCGYGSSITSFVYDGKYKELVYCATSQSATLKQQTYSAPVIVDQADNSTTILPLQLNLNQSVNENLNSIKQQLQNAGYSSSITDSITRDDILPLLATFPSSLYNPTTNTIVDNLELQKTRDNITSQILQQSETTTLSNEKSTVKSEVKEDNLTTPQLDNNSKLPEKPDFETTLGDMTAKDFLKPVRNFFDNFLNSLPFITVIRNAKIETNSKQSNVNFVYFGNSFDFDFATYSTVYEFMSRVIVFVASILAVLIIVM